MIYVGQTKLTLELETSTSLDTITSVAIAYQKPNKGTGQWTGTVSRTKIVYEVESGDLDMSGDWRIWSYVVFGDGKIGIGEVVKMNVKKQGEI